MQRGFETHERLTPKCSGPWNVTKVSKFHQPWALQDTQHHLLGVQAGVLTLHCYLLQARASASKRSLEGWLSLLSKPGLCLEHLVALWSGELSAVGDVTTK